MRKKNNKILESLKEFFRPTIGKIVITSLLSIMAVLAFSGFPYLSEIELIEDFGISKPKNFVVQPLEFLTDLLGITIDNDFFGLIALLLNYYLVSSIVIFTYEKFKKISKK